MKRCTGCVHLAFAGSSLLFSVFGAQHHELIH